MRPRRSLHCTFVHIFLSTFIFNQISHENNFVCAARHPIKPIIPKYAEQRYTKPGAKARIVRNLKRPLPSIANAVCRLTTADVYAICREVRDRQSYRDKYSMNMGPKTRIGSCERHKVKFLYDKKKEETVVRARQCPMEPPLWVSVGDAKGSAFVYSRVSGDILKFHDYVNLVHLYRFS